MSLTLRVLAGLVAGFVLGTALTRMPASAAGPIIAASAVAGAIFINLIRMTVIPLVASMLVASIGGAAASGALARVGLRAIASALVLLAAAAVTTIAIAQPVLSRVAIDAGAVAALRAQAAGTGGQASTATPTLGRWIVDLVPPNPVKAAADGVMLPVIVFAVLFALALAKVDAARRNPALNAIDGVAAAMQRLVAAILTLAPIGVFALAVPLAATLGASAAGAVAVYIVLVVALTLFVGAVFLYPVGILLGPLPARTFFSYCAPAQAVAFASRTSLAALPVMVESAERVNLPPLVSAVIVPLAASLFRLGAAVAQPVGVLFLARLYGIALGPTELVAIVFAVVLTSFAVPGIPFGSIIAMVPVLNAVSVPVEGIAILLAVDTIPDMFRTTENVTGSLVLAAIVAPKRPA